MADADGRPDRSTAERDLVSEGVGLLVGLAAVADIARGRATGIEGKVTPKFLLGPACGGSLTGLTILSGTGVGRGARLTLKRGEGEKRASHQVSADSQRSCAFDLIESFFLRIDLGRTGGGPEARFGVDMDALSSAGWLDVP